MKVICSNCDSVLSEIVESNETQMVIKGVRCPVCQNSFSVTFPKHSKHYHSDLLLNRRDYKDLQN